MGRLLIISDIALVGTAGEQTIYRAKTSHGHDKDDGRLVR